MAAKKKKKTSSRPTASKKTGAKKTAAPAPKDREMLIVGSKARQAIKDAGCNTGGDALDALNDLLHWYVQQAVARANANGRKTVRGYDFIVGQ